MATTIKNKIKTASVKSKLSASEREELIQLLTDTTNFEKSELKEMSTKELKDLHKSMEIPEWEEELEREKGNTGMKENGGEIPFDLWEEYSRPEKVKFLESIGMSSKYADYEWGDLTKTIQNQFEKMAMTPTDMSDKEKVEMWYDIADESEVDEVIRELGYKPYKFKTSTHNEEPVYPVLDKLGDEYLGLSAGRFRDDFMEYVIKNNPKIREWEFPSEEPTIDDIIPDDVELKNGGKTPVVSKGDKIAVVNNDMFSGEELEENSTVVSILSPTKITVSLGSDPTIQSYVEWIDNRWEITENVERKDRVSIPEIKGIGKFVPIAKIKEITEHFDRHKNPHGGRPDQAEGYAWMQTINKYSVLGDSAIVDRILAEHAAGKSAMDIHKVVKKLEDGGKPGDLSRSMQEIVEQSKDTVEHRYLMGKMDKDEYEKRLDEIKSFAEKKGLEFEHGGKTKEKESLYFPDDKLDYTNEMLIYNGWVTVGGRIEDFHNILKTKGRQKAYDEIKTQYAESADDVYRSVLVLDRLEKMGASKSMIYSPSAFPIELKEFQKDFRKKIVGLGEYNHYLVSKPVLEWDNSDYDNGLALKLKHQLEDGGKTESNDIMKQLIADGFINKDHTLTNKGRRIADLHKYCFPIGAHPFSYAQYTVDDLYSKPKYVTINDIIYYTDGFLVYELGGHLTDALRESAVQDHSLENSVNKTISKNLVEYNPYAYCPGVSFDDKSGSVKAGEGFIVFSNLSNSNEIYVNSFIFNYIVRNYRIDKWMADPKGGSLIHAVSGGVTQAILLVNANAVGVNASFTLFDRDKLMGGLRNKYAELFIKGKNYKDFISGWKENQVPDDLKKPADIEATIRGLEVLVEYAEDEAEIKQYNDEIYKLKSLLK